MGGAGFSAKAGTVWSFGRINNLLSRLVLQRTRKRSSSQKSCFLHLLGASRSSNVNHSPILARCAVAFQSINIRRCNDRSPNARIDYERHRRDRLDLLLFDAIVRRRHWKDSRHSSGIVVPFPLLPSRFYRDDCRRVQPCCWPACRDLGTLRGVEISARSGFTQSPNFTVTELGSCQSGCSTTRLPTQMEYRCTCRVFSSRTLANIPWSNTV